MAADRKSRATTAGRWLFATTIPISALAIGSLLTPWLVLASLAASIACAMLWLDAPKRVPHLGRLLLAVIGFLLLITAVQSIPLPASLVAIVAPSNADIWARCLAPFREAGPAWHPISVAPPSTHVEVLRGVLYASVFLGGLRIAIDDGGVTFLERIVVVAASLIAIVSLAHAAVGASRVFGLYVPHDRLGYEAGRLGPLLNQNHVAAYLNIGVATAFAAAVSRRDRELFPLPLVLGAVVLLSGTSVWAGSRGGSATLIVIAVLVLGMRVAARRSSRSTEAAVVGAALVAAGALVGLGTSDVARADLAGRDLSKLGVIRSAAGLIPGSPAFGIGRGAFETVYPVVYHGPNYVSFRAVENFVVHWLVEWGVIAALIALVGFAVALRPRVVTSAARPPIGLWVAVIATALHDLVDFHLEVPGIVVLALTCLAGIAGARPRARVPSTPADATRASRVRRIALVAPGIALATIVVAAPGIGHSLLETRDHIAATAVDPSVPHEGFQRELRAAMLRFPSEPFFPLAGAIHEQANGRNVVPWIARALERYPSFGRAHLVLARSLVRTNRAQARLEYRLAYQADVGVRAAVGREAPMLVDDYDAAMELVPESGGGELIERLSTTLAPRLPATSARLDDELLRREPSAVGPLRRQLDAAASDLRNQHPWCMPKQACLETAIGIGRALAARDEKACLAHVALARVRIAAGEITEALDDLTRASETAADRATCLRSLVELSLETGDKRRADRAIEVTLKTGCGAREECTALYAWAAGVAETRGNHVRAIALYKRAAEVDPTTDEHLKRAAAIAEQVGLNAEAADAYDRLASRHPEEPRYRTRANELRTSSAQRWRDAGADGAGFGN